MNGIDPPAPWRKATAPDGRIYYYNSITQATSWVLPTAPSQPWKEYETPDGRKYWNNSITKQSVWEMPAEFKASLAEADNSAALERPVAAAPAFVAGGGGAGMNHDYNTNRRPRDDMPDRQSNFNSSDGFRQSFLPASTNEPEFRSDEEAEEAFAKLLQRAGVKTDWSWQQTQRAVISDPHYRAIKEPKQRKLAFEKFKSRLREEELANNKEARKKFRADFTERLKDFEQINPTSRWETIKPLIESQPGLKFSASESAKREVFEDYVSYLVLMEYENKRKEEQLAVRELRGLMAALEISENCSYKEAQAILTSNERYQHDKLLNSMSPLTALQVWKEYSTDRQNITHDSEKREELLKNRQARKNREAFKALLQDLARKRVIRAKAVWKDVLPHFQQSPEYQHMFDIFEEDLLPLQLFWEVVEVENEKLRRVKDTILDVCDHFQKELTMETTFEDIQSYVQHDPRTAKVPSEDLKAAFDSIRDKMQRRAESDARQRERKQSKKIRALRYRMERQNIRSTDKWEDVVVQLSRFEEFKDAETDEVRKAAFEKHIRRARQEEEERHEKSRDRERDREHYASRRRVRYSHSPEPDPYEADRARASADRERQYRRPSFGLDAGFDHFDERDRERRPSGRLNGYGRDRHDHERERLYPPRADPRDGGAARELDYGDTAGSMSDRSARKRRESSSIHSEQRGDNKKPRLEQLTKEEKEEEVLKSGSEEGEIEED